jgi:hypothetical protein
VKLDEFLARVLAARKMKLITDAYGMRLPEELWAQAKPDAEFLISALMFYDQIEIARAYYYEAEEGE